MSEEKLRSIEEIKEEIERIRNLLEKEKRGTSFGKGKLSGLYFALGINLNFDGEEI